MHNRLVLDVDWLDEMKIECCQREYIPGNYSLSPAEL